jgi:L-prolyl-PCP dehydrogenase
MPNESPETLIQIEAAAREFALALNGERDFASKWNSEAGSFFRSLTVPAERNGSGVTAETCAKIMYQLGHHSSNNGFNFSMAAHLFAAVIPLGNHGKNEVHFSALENIVQGSVGANAMTESGSGSDSFAMKTVAVRKEKAYVLNGTKIFVTNGPVARYFIVYALTDPVKGFFGGISCFLLDRTQHRFTIGPAIEKSSLKNSPMCELFFDDCVIAEEYRLGQEGAGAMIFMESMDWERSCIAGMHAGTMRRLCDGAAEYVKQRIRGEQTLAQLQGVQFKIADIDVMTETAKLMAIRAAALTDQKKGTVAAAQAKILASEYLAESAKLAILLQGGNGIVSANGLTDVLADAQAAMVYSGPNDVLRDLIASRL